MNVYRYNQYYQMQEIFDELYDKSIKDNKFYNLMDLIKSENNIRLAFRMIKGNTGSETCGTDGLTINDIKEFSLDEMHCHHVLPREFGGKDNYENLRIVHKDIHILIHAIDEETIKKYIGIISQSQNTIKRVLDNLNKHRVKANRKIIKEEDVREWLQVKTWKTHGAKVV